MKKKKMKRKNMHKLNKPIIIKLNPNYHVGRENYIPNQEEELAELIIDRVRKYESFANEHKTLTNEELYEQVKRYDSVHIDGARGTGKSTVIKFLAESKDCESCIELREKVEFLSLVDPNQLDKDTNIIDIVTDLMYSHVTEFYKKMDSKDRELHKKISDYKCKIDKLTFKTHKKDYENAVVRQETTRNERKLDYTFHQYSEACCQLLGKKVLVLPLDDIDMRLDIGVDILETIRKYFQTPHLVPVIALDSSQAYALVKKNYYEKFDYKASTIHSEIKAGSGMVFLKKLPSEYLQKILPPSQRIALYDMLDYYKDEYYKKDKDEKYQAIYFYKELKNGSSKVKEVTLSFKELIKLIMNILFDYKDSTNDYSPDDYRIINYLKNKSFRSFLDDARALMRGLEFNPELTEYQDERVTTYKLNTRNLKTRFQLYSRGTATNKYDGAMWFWDRYIDRVYAELDKVGKKDDYYKVDYIVTDLINEILIIDPHDTSSLGRKEKIYYRLFLQEFFIEEINVEFSEADEKGNNKIKRVIKTYNMQGYLEFIMRTLFPASMFEILVNDKIISVLKFPIEQLRDFASPHNKTTLKELYDEWLPFWTEMYPQKIKQFDENAMETEVLEIFNPLAVKIKEENTGPFRKVLFFTTRENYRRGEQSYYVHPFKMFSYLAEYHKDVSDDFYYNYMPKGYMNIRGKRLSSLKNRMKSYSQGITKLLMSDELAMLSIIDTIDNVQNLSRNILLSLLVKPQKIQKEFCKILKDEYGLEEEHINLLYKVELQKTLSSSTSELLNMILGIFLTQVKYKEDVKRKSHLSEEPKFDINSSPIRAALHKKSILMPFIKDDPLLRNLKILHFTSLKKEKAFIDYLSMYFFIAELDRIYYPEEGLYKKEYFDYFYTSGQEKSYDLIFNDSGALRKLIKNNVNLKKAYLQLFWKYLSKERLKGKFKKLYNEEKGILKKEVDKFITEELKTRKDSFSSKSKHISKNITILLIDSMTMEEPIIPAIIEMMG